MSLRHRSYIVLGFLGCWGVLHTIHAQEPSPGPNLFTNENRLKDAAPLTRTGAR
jgi:hypothetical protein